MRGRLGRFRRLVLARGAVEQVGEPTGLGRRLSRLRARIDLDYVYRFLSLESYWARDVTRDVVATMIGNSLLNFGLYGPDGKQVGFARVVGDGATFAYIADVFIDPALKGRGSARRCSRR